MEDIYDRSKWPSPEANPLVVMLQRGDEWYSNREIVQALGLSERRALLSRGTIFSRQLDASDAAIKARGQVSPGVDFSASHGGQERVFSARALVLAAMRTNTVNAAAFRDWMASQIAEGVGHDDA